MRASRSIGGIVNKLFFLFYSFVSILIYIVVLPFLFLLSFKTKYRQSIPARFFLWKNPPLKSGGIWFHSCSFGEAKAIAPLVEVLPKALLRMTTTTQTGKSVIDTYTKQSRYLPFEPLLFGWLRPQKALVVMEAEFWYLLFALAKHRGARTLLINARMSDRSFAKYLKMTWLYRQIFRHIDTVYAQTPKDKVRLEQLGAKNVTVTGNIKLALLPKPTKIFAKPDSLLVCAASTHRGEEVIVLDAFETFLEEHPEAKLAVVPRHPERFEEAAQLVEAFAAKRGVSWHRYSQRADFESTVTLVDALGELVNIYAISDIVILGGAFVPVGGHNAAEAAQFGCRILSGPHYFNQKDIFEAVEGIAIVEPANLGRRLLQYGQIKPATLLWHTDLTPIVKELEALL